MGKLAKEQAANLVIQNLIAAWNEKNLAKLGACFAEEGDFVDILGHKASGRKNIEALHQFPFSTGLKKAHLSEESLEYRELGGSLIAADLRWKNEGVTNRQGEPIPDQFGNMYLVIQVENGQGHLLSVRNTNYSGDIRV